MTKEKRNLLIAGIITGIVSVLLVRFGNPRNMGFCIACFIRDIAGALKFHTAAPVQYMRPEIIGIILGAFAISFITGEFKSRSGSSPLLRFFISFAVMIGALCFLGCPFRMILRLSAGDAYALFGLGGFALGIAAGVFFLNRGFELGRSYEQRELNGFVLPAVNVGLFLLLVAFPSYLAFSSSGPGSMHAAVVVSLAAGLIVGILAQRTRFCMAGGIRDMILFKDVTLLLGFAAIFVSALVMNLIFGYFHFGFAGQPVVNKSVFWGTFGMFAVGFGSCLLGGCPLRQLILAAEGNTDSAFSVLGMFAGAALVHNFSLAGNADAERSMPKTAGKVAVVVCIVFLFAVAVLCTFRKECNKENTQNG